MAQEKKTLARPVTVAGRTYMPGDDIPDKVAAQIRNPKAWLTDVETAAALEEAGGKPAGTSDGRLLATAVTVAGRTYTPGDHLPDDVAAQIRNPKAWAQGSAPAPAEPPEGETAADTGEGKQAKKAPAKKP